MRNLKTNMRKGTFKCGGNVKQGDVFKTVGEEKAGSGQREWRKALLFDSDMS